MSTPSSKHNPKSLEARALKIIAEREKVTNLSIARSAEDTVPSTGTKLYMFSAIRKDEPNSPPYTVVLDESGEVVDPESLGKREGVTLFARGVPLDVEKVLPLASPAASITISPTDNDLTLNAGDSLDEVVTVTVPKDTGVSQVDVYFLADTTGSMSGILAAIQTDANSILTALAGLGLDMAFGVGNYKDFPIGVLNPFAFQHQLSPTTVVMDVTTNINAWSATGGSDGSEGQLFALDQLAEPAGGTIGWRAGSKRIILWFGDAPGHDSVCAAISGAVSDITEASATAKLVAEQISVIAISTTTGFLNALDDDPTASASDYPPTCAIGGTAGQATRIATATGGTHQMGVDVTNIVNTIILLISTAATQINNLSLVATGGTAPFVVSISPAGGYGPLAGNIDHVLPFKVVFRGILPCSEEPQVFTGTLDAIADGVVVARKRVRVTVPACEELFSYSVKFICGVEGERGGDGDDDDDHERKHQEGVVSPGTYATEINIHNFNETEVQVEKYVLPVVLQGEPIGREPKFVERMAKDHIVLPPNTATMDDCYRIGELLFGSPPPSPMPLMIGFLEIVSRRELSITAVYTATDLRSRSVSIDVEQIQGKRKPIAPRA
jgi:hypothetical protein